MKILTASLIMMLTGAVQASEQPTLIRYQELMKRAPDIQGENIRVWTIRKNETIRVNLVEMSGELGLHKHPDAAHSLMVLEGSMRVQMGNDFSLVGKGDFVSIPADLPHKYWSLTPKLLLISMDAPYYRRTIRLENAHSPR